MSPGSKHELIANIISDMITTLSLEWSIDLTNFGSTTFNTEPRGFEADKSCYLDTRRRIRDMENIDLSIDPPPDLVVEVDISSDSKQRLTTYAALRVRKSGALSAAFSLFSHSLTGTTSRRQPAESPAGCRPGKSPNASRPATRPKARRRLQSAPNDSSGYARIDTFARARSIRRGWTPWHAPIAARPRSGGGRTNSLGALRIFDPCRVVTCRMKADELFTEARPARVRGARTRCAPARAEHRCRADLDASRRRALLLLGIVA
jgi:hypothetical protein